MSDPGTCSKHNIKYETDEEDCRRCGGDGCIEDDDYGYIEWVTCWQCRGSGEVSFPVCFKCDEEYEEEAELEMLREEGK